MSNTDHSRRKKKQTGICLLCGIVVCLVFCVQSLQAEIPPAPHLPDLSQARIAELLEDLDSNHYSDRVAATRELKAGGSNVIQALSKELKTQKGEVALRGFYILRGLFFRSLTLEMDEQSDLLDTVFLQLVNSNGTGGRVARFMDQFSLPTGQHALLIEKNALRRLVAKGASLRPARFQERLPNEVQTRRFDIIINKNWKGSPESIPLFKRVHSVNVVYILNNAKLSEEQMAAFNANIAGKIAFRGSAILGVSGSRGDGGAFVNTVTKNGPAEQAGIQSNDLILQIGKTKVASFPELIEAVGEHDPGDRVPVKLLRGNLFKTVTVKLGEW